MKRNLILAGLVLAVAAAAVWAQASGTNYFEQGGARTVIGGALDVISGGEIDVESGGALKIGGTAMTATAAELNYLDITAAGTAQASKALITDASIDIGGLRNLTATGTVQGANVTATSALTGATAAIGGGYGSTGVSVSAAGNIQANGTLTVDGTSTLTGAVTVTGALNANGGAAVAGGDVTLGVSDLNLGAKNEFIGLPRIKFAALAAGTNGSTETTSYIDETPVGEWTAVDADVTVSTDAARVRFGTGSLELLFLATAADDDGAVNNITDDNLESNESIGMWVYCSEALDAGDLDLLIDDDTADTTFDIPAVAANVWTWVEVDISALAAGTGDVVEQVGIVLKDAAGHGEFTCFFDGMWKWDASDEEALASAIQTDGVLGIMSVLTAQDQVNSQTVLVENTDYFTHYESGVDFIVWITDQSARSNTALIAY